MHNEGNYIISLGNLCRWLGQQAEALGVEIYPGFAAQDADHRETAWSGRRPSATWASTARASTRKASPPGMELRAKYTLFAEGCRGHIGKQLIKQYQLDKDADPQHYAIGLKELWDIDPAKHSSPAWSFTAPAGRWTMPIRAARSCITSKTTRSWSA